MHLQYNEKKKTNKSRNGLLHSFCFKDYNSSQISQHHEFPSQSAIPAPVGTNRTTTFLMFYILKSGIWCLGLCC